MTTIQYVVFGIMLWLTPSLLLVALLVCRPSFDRPSEDRAIPKERKFLIKHGYAIANSLARFAAKLVTFKAASRAPP
jgi:hypothetical protein